MGRRGLAYDVRVSFTLADGRELAYCYAYTHDPGSYFYPPETDCGEGHLELDGEEVDPDTLPRGLGVIAALLESDPLDSRFTSTETYIEPDGPEPDDFDTDEGYRD